jgi:hypothetical protein
MGQNQGWNCAAHGTPRTRAFNTQAPGQRRGDEADHRRYEEALAFAENRGQISRRKEVAPKKVAAKKAVVKARSAKRLPRPRRRQ